MIHVLEKSLLARVLAGSLSLFAVTVFGLTFLFLWAYSRDVDRQIAGRAESLAEFLAGQSQFAMLVGDRSDLERIARNAVSSDQVVLVELTDGESAAPVRFHREGGRRPGRDFIEIYRQVLRPAEVSGGGWEPPSGGKSANPAVLGTVRLQFSTEKEHAARIRIVWTTLGVALALLISAAILQALELRTLLRPLQSLTEFTRRVAEGNLDGRAEVVRADEVGRLSIAFNTMVERLGATLVS